MKEGSSPKEVSIDFVRPICRFKRNYRTNKVIFQLVNTYLEKMRADTVKQAVETIRNRIDRYGVAEPSIRQLGTNRVALNCLV